MVGKLFKKFQFKNRCLDRKMYMETRTYRQFDVHRDVYLDSLTYTVVLKVFSTTQTIQQNSSWGPAINEKQQSVYIVHTIVKIGESKY